VAEKLPPDTTTLDDASTTNWLDPCSCRLPPLIDSELDCTRFTCTLLSAVTPPALLTLTELPTNEASAFCVNATPPPLTLRLDPVLE